MVVRNIGRDQTGANETRPLLSSAASIEHASPNPAPSHRSRCTWPWIRVVVLVIVIAIIGDIGETMYNAPRVRLFESVICTRHYLQTDPSLVDPHGNVPERLCKGDFVQDQLASILGWQFFIDSIPAILLPIPFGYLADKYGRKWIMMLAMVGYTLSFAWAELVVALQLPLRLVWLSSVFFLIGGGPTTATTLLTTVVTDVVPPELRGTVFFYRFCTDLVAELITPPITAALMSKDVWIPLVGAVLIQGVSTLMITIIPETLPVPVTEPHSDLTTAALSADGTEDTDDMADLSREKWTARLHTFWNSFGFVTRHTAVSALVLTFMISKIGRQSSNILFQYASKRYGWSLAQAGLLVSLRAAVNIALFIVILPAVTAVALSKFTAASKDLLIAKGSIVMLAVGNLIIFLSASPVVMVSGVILFVLGSGFAPTVRSLVTSLVEIYEVNAASDIGRLYALISVMEGIGSLIAAPGMAFTFRVGMSLGLEWVGLPFGFAASLFALVALIVFSVRLRDV